MNTKKLSNINDEDELVQFIIERLKKNDFTYGNFEQVVSRVKSFYEDNATI